MKEVPVQPVLLSKVYHKCRRTAPNPPCPLLIAETDHAEFLDRLFYCVQSYRTHVSCTIFQQMTNMSPGLAGPMKVSTFLILASVGELEIGSMTSAEEA